jgi:hypothetical protein
VGCSVDGHVRLLPKRTLPNISVRAMLGGWMKGAL